MVSCFVAVRTCQINQKHSLIAFLFHFTKPSRLASSSAYSSPSPRSELIPPHPPLPSHHYQYCYHHHLRDV